MSAMEITRKIEQLPPDMQQEEHDFVDFLAKKSRRQRRHLHMAPPTQAVVAGTPFREGADIATQAQLQGVKPVTDFEACWVIFGLKRKISTSFSKNYIDCGKKAATWEIYKAGGYFRKWHGERPGPLNLPLVTGIPLITCAHWPAGMPAVSGVCVPAG